MDYYEKLYKDAINRAKKIYKTAQDYLCKDSKISVECIKNALTDVFPELKESEDERIRTLLISSVKNETPIANEHNKELAIAWLEKQGEKLPVGFYFVNSDGKKFYSDTFKYGDVILHVEKQDEQETLCDKCRKEQPSHSCQDITALGRCEVEHEQKTIYKAEEKSTWSEEDENRIEYTIYFLETTKNHYASTVEIEACIDWLKSIKERMKGEGL